MDILDENQWTLTLVFVSALLVFYYFYLCFIKRVLESFGRRALDTSSIIYLFGLTCVPTLYFFTLYVLPKTLNVTNATLAMLILFISTLSSKELMQWLAEGIRIPFKAELDK